jgi:hypothetical protein
MRQANMSCFELFMHAIPCASVFDFDNAGNSIAARMAMMAMTTSSSIKVKARVLERQGICVLIAMLIPFFMAACQARAVLDSDSCLLDTANLDE